MSILEFLIIPLLLFISGAVGIFLNRKNLILIIISIELLLLAINLIMIISSAYLDDKIGQFFTLFVLIVAASETFKSTNYFLKICLSFKV